MSRSLPAWAIGMQDSVYEVFPHQGAPLLLSCFAQFPLDEPRPAPSDYPSGGKFDEVLSSADMDPSLSTDPIVPCPRRFGATFAANGTLVVFCSSLVVVRAGKDDGRKRHGGNRKQVKVSTGVHLCALCVWSVNARLWLKVLLCVARDRAATVIRLHPSYQRRDAHTI